MYSVLYWDTPTESEGDMSHATWRARAARSAEAPAEELTPVHKDSVEIGLWMDDAASLSLTLHKTISTRKPDSRVVVQEELTLSCKTCTEMLYRSTHGLVRLEDLSEARTTGQLHLSECKPQAKAESETVEKEPPAGQAPAITTPEQPPRTYCD